MLSDYSCYLLTAVNFLELSKEILKINVNFTITGISKDLFESIKTFLISSLTKELDLKLKTLVDITMIHDNELMRLPKPRYFAGTFNFTASVTCLDEVIKKRSLNFMDRGRFVSNINAMIAKDPKLKDKGIIVTNSIDPYEFVQQGILIIFTSGIT